MVKHTIDHYISNLLYFNECVVVPGFGAFLTRYFSAEVNSATHMFRPPSKRVAFNARIQENDGLLAKHISKTEGVSYEKAMESIEISVRSWKKVLRAGRKVNLTGIGRLYMSDTGKLQFNPAHDINYDIQSYGLNIFRANAMEREQEIKRSVNKAIEKHQGKKVKAKVEPKEDAKVRQLNFRRWTAVLGPVAAAMLVGAYLYVTPGSFNTVKEQVSGIFINHSQDTLESPTYSDIASNEAGLGFQEPEGPRLNGEYGPEDDVLTEEQISEEAIDPTTEANETATISEETAPAEAIIEENSKPALVDLPQNSEEKSSTEIAEDKAESPVKENSKKVHYNFSAKGKPLYNVKKRPEDLATSNTPNYKPKTEKQPKTVAAQPKIASESEMAPAKAIVVQNKSEQNKAQKATEQKVNPNTSAQANLADAGEFQIIVGAFSSAANANNYVEQLKGQGWSAYSYRAGNLNRVAIGKLKNRDQANSLLGQVKQQVNSRAWVNQL
ncbi:HU domain-containing protein [Croceimicrobium hydrocarbonivorans]|uniref:SPOR domain-containing protein n=1 Tax=Croceimicrobium hydrocarbonivorans TaxID=2761580 RepID=A0A7H0VJ05_9FLAO|nr:SPOR domain-containing protein [Croceimicrobium hydrocarbonivorans]QNR25703.1 SPOR domain-containing protein [Croceimicrobium hydrocarbonivorans]